MPSLLDAINDKYGVLGETFDHTPINICIPKGNPRKYVPSLLVLNDCNIDSAGQENDLKDKCDTVEDLDLAQNNLSNWNEIFTIFRLMPKLKFANLSFNDLSRDILLDYNEVWNRNNNNVLQSFSCLKNIVLNATRITWPNVRHILKLLPNIEELHLSFNDYDDVHLANEDGCNPIVVPSVRKLHFSGNPISTWVNICKLSRSFPRLESLVLAECPISSLDIVSQTECNDSSTIQSDIEQKNVHCSYEYNCFNHLKFLNLNNTLLDTWDDVIKLSKFPSLTCLRILGCPLFDDYTQHERRQLLIANLPNVTVLNGGGVITAEEREDAERAFIRFYMDKDERDRPSRYTDLIAAHGKLDPLVHIDFKPERTIRVLFICGSSTEERSINVYQTVNDLKQKLENFSKIPASKMKLFYLDQHMKMIRGPEEMKFPNKRLYGYNIHSGDEIIIDTRQKK